jgi:hypothetical protein
MICEPKDKKIFADLMMILMRKVRKGCPISELVLEAGKYFIGAAYAASTLGHLPESLVINLREFDCFTLVENATVLALTALSGRTDFLHYAKTLQSFRYRSSNIDGYHSRLHYFTDWIHEAARQGILYDLTRTLGGQCFRKKIHYMTSNRERYPGLEDDDSYHIMRKIEKRISRRIRYMITGEQLPSVLDEIADGDIIAILTDRDGLDCQHVGLAIHCRGRLRLLHASSEEDSVVITDQSLSAYLAAHDGRTGILIARMVG